MKSTTQYVYWTFLVICGGFAVLEFFQGSVQNAALWLLVLAAGMMLYSYLTQKKKSAQHPPMESVLEPETQAALARGDRIAFDPAGIRLRSAETCLWYDHAAQDHYDGKQGTMYLTDERLLFVADGFSFTHPLKTLQIQPTRRGIELNVLGKKMRFVTASTSLLLQVWEALQ